MQAELKEVIKDTECPICLNTIHEKATTDTCIHEFCLVCITKWTENRNRCPKCTTMYRWILRTNENEQSAQIRVNQPLIIDEQYNAEREQALLQIETLFLRLLLYQEGIA